MKTYRPSCSHDSGTLFGKVVAPVVPKRFQDRREMPRTPNSCGEHFPYMPKVSYGSQCLIFSQKVSANTLGDKS